MMIDRDERPKEWPRDPDPEDDAADELKPWRTRLEAAFDAMTKAHPGATLLLIAITPGDTASEERQFHALTTHHSVAGEMAAYFLNVHSQERRTGGEGNGSEARH